MPAAGEEVTGAATGDDYLAAGSGGAIRRYQRGGAVDVRARVLDLHGAARSSGAVCRDLAGIQHVAGTDADVSSGCAIGVDLAGVDEHGRGGVKLSGGNGSGGLDVGQVVSGQRYGRCVQ